VRQTDRVRSPERAAPAADRIGGPACPHLRHSRGLQPNRSWNQRENALSDGKPRRTRGRNGAHPLSVRE